MLELNYTLLLFALIMSVIDAFMMFSIKQYSLHKYDLFYGMVIPIAIYAVQPLIFYKAITSEGIGAYNILWDSMSNLLVLMTGIYFFSETLSLRKYIGVILSFVCILLLAEAR
jgi:multidrug transporter EmrE-like cation transporter